MSSEQQRDRQISQNQINIQGLIDSSKNANELPELNIPLQDDDVFIVRANGVTYHVKKSALKDVLKGEVTLLSFIENILSIGVDGQETPLSVDLSSLDQSEEIKELSEIPSGLTMFELKDGELYLSVDGEMPKKVNLSPIASEVKTVKLTITAAEIREASQYIDGNDNPNLTPVVLVPNPADGSAVVATEVLCKTTPINGMYDDSGGMGWIMPNKDLTLVLDHKEDYYQLMLNSSFLSPNYGDEPLGSPRYEKAKERDVGGFLNIGEAYNSFEEGKGIIFLFNEYLDAYPGTSIELIIKYQNITF